MSSVTIFQSDHFVLSTNFLFKFNVSLPLVTGELLQNTVDVNNVTYKLYNIKLQRLPVLLNTKKKHTINSRKIRTIIGINNIT